MNLTALPDKGVKLKGRKDQLEIELKAYREKISNMIVQDGKYSNTF